MDKVPKHPLNLPTSMGHLSKSGYSLDVLNVQYSGITNSFTQLIGREHEVGVVCDVLKRPEVRLLTLTGPGGVGKTRLARQVLAELQQAFADGSCFVTLASINDSPQVLAEIHRALRLKRVESGTFCIQLKDYLEKKQFLLVLDNFEQVIPAAPLLLELLSTCAGLKLLLTSRSILSIHGEYEFTVPPLKLPDMKRLPNKETLTHVAAVALFMQRAQAVKHGFQLNDANAVTIAAICTRLDGLPLAVELAAARIKLLSPTALLARLERRLQVLTGGGPDLPERQHTIHDTIKWSYDLLTTQEQLLFRRLAVFVGGCTLETIEAFNLSLGGISISILDGITSLLDKSLIQRAEQEGEEPRFQMLETVREYDLEELAACGELVSMREAHAEYYLALIRQAEPTFLRMSREPRITQLDHEYANMRIALEWSLEQKETDERIDRALQLAVALGQIWFNRGELSEGRGVLERALAASLESTVPVSKQSQANALYIAGALASWQYDFEQVHILLEESLELFQKLGDERGIVFARSLLGMTLIHRGNIGMGDAMLEEVLSLCRQVGDREGIADTLLKQGDAAFYRGEYIKARACCEESLALYHELEDTFGKAVSLLSLGWVAYSQGEYATASQHLDESVEQFRIFGNAGFQIEAMTFLAFTKAAQGDVPKASSLLNEVLVMGQEQTHKVVIAQAIWGLGRLALDQNKFSEAHAHFEESLASMKGKFIHTRFKWVIAACLEGLGEISLIEGRPTEVAWLYSAADALRFVQGYRNPLGIQQPDYDYTLAEARRQLGAKVFASVWGEGHMITLEQALAAESQTPMLNQASKELTAASITEQQPGVSSPSSSLLDALTAREIEVLRLVVEGLTNKQIAEMLVISPSTVDTHIQSIYNRLGISSRSAATRYAISHKLI